MIINYLYSCIGADAAETLTAMAVEGPLGETSSPRAHLSSPLGIGRQNSQGSNSTSSASMKSNSSRRSDGMSRSSSDSPGERAAPMRYRFAASPAGGVGNGGATMRGVSSLMLRKSRQGTRGWLWGDGRSANGSVPGILPYMILTFAGIVGLLLPFLELTGQGLPKLAMVRL